MNYKCYKFDVSKETQSKMIFGSDKMTHSEIVSEIISNPKILLNCKDDFAIDELVICESALYNPDVKKYSRFYQINLGLQKDISYLECLSYCYLLDMVDNLYDEKLKRIIDREDEVFGNINALLKSDKKMGKYIKKIYLKENRMVFTFVPLKKLKFLKLRTIFSGNEDVINREQNIQYAMHNFCVNHLIKREYDNLLNDCTFDKLDEYGENDIFDIGQSFLESEVEKLLIPMINQELEECFIPTTLIKKFNIEDEFTKLKLECKQRNEELIKD